MTAEEFLQQNAKRRQTLNFGNFSCIGIPYEDALALLKEYASQQRAEIEFEICECGHTVPIGYIHYDQDGGGTCINCFNDELIFRLGKKNKQIKRLREKVKKQQIACIRLGFEAARLVDNSI